MLILFAFVLLVLAAAVGMLYAMCAELASRVGSGSGGTAEPARYVRPLGRSSVFLRDSVPWPAELADLRAQPDFLLVVLSTSCSSCNGIMEQLGSGWADRAGGRLGVLMSTPDPQVAADSIAKHRLDEFPHYVDLNGDWVTAALGLSLSPVGLVFRHGLLEESYVFNHVDPLWTTFTEVMEWQTHTQQNGDRPADSAAVASSAPSAQVV